MKIISVIPARGGSKSIPLKNLAKLNGKHLIYYSIKQSIKCKEIQRTFVSTDNHLIRKLAIKYGAEAPFLRPKNISRDSSNDLGFFKHLIKWLKKNENYEPDLIVQLRPTQPFRPNYLIEKCIRKFKNNLSADCLRTIAIPERSPYKMWKVKGKYIQPLILKKNQKEFINMDRRALPKIYWHDGNIDIVKTKTILKYNSLTGKKVLFYKNDLPYLIDIDEKRNLKIANLLIKTKKIKI